MFCNNINCFLIVYIVSGDIMDIVYNTRGLDYIDGNKYNNSLSNLK